MNGCLKWLKFGRDRLHDKARVPRGQILTLRNCRLSTSAAFRTVENQGNARIGHHLHSMGWRPAFRTGAILCTPSNICASSISGLFCKSHLMKLNNYLSSCFPFGCLNFTSRKTEGTRISAYTERGKRGPPRAGDVRRLRLWWPTSRHVPEGQGMPARLPQRSDRTPRRCSPWWFRVR
jgi:hypothetical protein